MKILQTIFPFIATLLFWRLSLPFWNPGGVLAIIPIFYYSFIRPANWFAVFAACMCFVIDYYSDTMLFWVSVFCLFYAVNGFQNFIDITRQKNDGLFVFMFFFGICLLILSVANFSFIGFVHNLWLFLWASILYIPFAASAKRIGDDR